MLPLQPVSTVCSCKALIGTENCCSFAELPREKGNSIAFTVVGMISFLLFCPVTQTGKLIFQPIDPAW